MPEDSFDRNDVWCDICVSQEVDMFRCEPPTQLVLTGLDESARDALRVLAHDLRDGEEVTTIEVTWLCSGCLRVFFPEAEESADIPGALG